MKIKTYTGFEKKWLNIKIKLYVFIHILSITINGKLAPSKLFKVLNRLLIFLSMMKNNKYVKLGNSIKLNLYLPGFPSKAFYHACNKVTVFDTKMPCVSVLISVTSACRYRCEHCYQKYDSGKDVDIDLLIKAAKYLQDEGVAFFNLEGGEPFLVFERLYKLCSAIDHRSEIIINTTGDGVTLDNLHQLLQRGNVSALMFSLHSSNPEAINDFAKNDKAWDNLTHAINLCSKTGMGIMFNSCLTRDSLYNGTFETIMEKAREFGGTLIQLIKPKPAGGWLNDAPENFSENDIQILKKKVDNYNLSKEFKDYPFVYSQLIEEEPEMFGCTAGGTDRFYINAKGDVQPCEFLNISFGNIQEQDFKLIYQAMRKEFNDAGDCLICEQCARDINFEFQNDENKSLPLSPEVTKKIIRNWNRGNLPYFYKKVKQ
jgi:MoaA/NifB/PqqE/SkfB family radical SAM enzyme